MTNITHTILFVEDEADIMMMYKVKFESSGFTFLGADNSKDALRLAQSQKPELILLDILLDKENGLDILKQLKENDATKQIPVMLFSNAYQEENERRGRELGAERFIVKTKILPVEMVRLVQERLISK